MLFAASLGGVAEQYFSPRRVKAARYGIGQKRPERELSGPGLMRYAHLAPDQRREAVAKPNEQPVLALTVGRLIADMVLPH